MWPTATAMAPLALAGVGGHARHDGPLGWLQQAFPFAAAAADVWAAAASTIRTLSGTRSVASRFAPIAVRSSNQHRTSSASGERRLVAGRERARLDRQPCLAPNPRVLKYTVWT